VDRVFASGANGGSSSLPGVMRELLSSAMQTLVHPKSTLTDNSKLTTICKSQRHAFHILDSSVYPFLVSIFLFVLLISVIADLHGIQVYNPLCYRGCVPSNTSLAFIFVLITAMSWFTSIVVEAGQGYHTSKVQHGLKMGMLLFILSEVMLFFAFFWGFFHFSLVPSVNIGATWPPEGTQLLDPWGLPLGNTLLLLYSGVTVTAAHALILSDRHREFSWALALTILLGVVFLLCQAYEYKYGIKFTWRESVFGSIFFLTTGFHGMHVTIGTMFLIFCLFRQVTSATPTNPSVAVPTVSIPNGGFTAQQHLGFEAAAWYWHFVDVVWLFLYLSVYWWGTA
jgi:heme/copper-type cytochrome/quinol oxidase subunit 3